jgi:hypothetical protein
LSWFLDDTSIRKSLMTVISRLLAVLVLFQNLHAQQ